MDFSCAAMIASIPSPRSAPVLLQESVAPESERLSILPNEKRAAGIRYHESHNQRLRAARQQRVVSGVVMLVCLLIFVIMLGSAHLWSQ
jgi:hypothetical protein